VDKARPAVTDFLETLWVETGLGAADTVLAGFSQGAMMALHVGTALTPPLAAIVSFSGAFMPPPGFGRPGLGRPPVALIHGDADPVVDVGLSRQAAAELEAAGFEVALHISSGAGHGIAPDGLAFATAFLAAHAGATKR
jgi:phospholipase/carboxylesterase